MHAPFCPPTFDQLISTMGRVQILRNILLSTSFLINLPATGFVIHLLYVSARYPAGPYIYSFQILGLVVGALALLFIPALLIGRITVMFDIIVMFSFWVLWIAEAALAAQFRILFYNYEKAKYDSLGRRYGQDWMNRNRFHLDCTSISSGYCYEFYIVQNLMISLFVSSFIHFTGLLIYGFVRQSREEPIWKTSIRRLNKPEYPAFIMAPQGAWQATVIPAASETEPASVATPVNKESRT
ncbi:hypothetical protein BJ165DRAFT_1452562 [Panaeolus papilionaceus]|nr:hypothetical protein BJ165DRAFT_1452562 [Panaeolus papilionaceus]